MLEVSTFAFEVNDQGGQLGAIPAGDDQTKDDYYWDYGESGQGDRFEGPTGQGSVPGAVVDGCPDSGDGPHGGSRGSDQEGWAYLSAGGPGAADVHNSNRTHRQDRQTG